MHVSVFKFNDAMWVCICLTVKIVKKNFFGFLCGEAGELIHRKVFRRHWFLTAAQAKTVESEPDLVSNLEEKWETHLQNSKLVRK